MAATIQIVRLTGAGPTATDVTGINSRMNAEDTHTTAGVSNPIRIPAAGTNYSYWATFRLNAVTSPTSSISNVKWYTDGTGSLGTGVGLVMNTATSYVQATGTAGVTGLELTTGNHAGLAGAPTDAFAFTSGSPKSITASLSNPTTGQFGDRVVCQVTVGTTAGPGATPSETLTWQYDEV